MRSNSKDDTLKRNYIQKYQYLIGEYERVKSKSHKQFRYVKDFYQAYGVCPQTFLKYYGRYKLSGEDAQSLLPQKRGPRYKSRRFPLAVEEAVIDLRRQGCNRYEIHQTLQDRLIKPLPSPSGVYKIILRNQMNKLSPPEREEKRRIIKEKAGELGHVDCHHLSKDMIANDPKRRYLVGVVDSQSRLAWVEVVDDIKSLTVMFAVLRCFNQLKIHYGIEFKEVLTDNGPEFGTKQSQSKESHPFERLLMEMHMKHRYIRPYRPQTNGKIERFWRTLNEDLIEETYFENLDHFNDELLQYIVYYNQMRPHQALGGKTPQQALKLT